jgi:hypothetical protein
MKYKEVSNIFMFLIVTMIVIWGEKMAYLTMVVARYGDSFSMKISLSKSPYGNVKMIIL